jgi:hypothetical protein
VTILRQFLAELRKMAHPIMLVPVALVLGAALATDLRAEQFASVQVPLAEAGWIDGEAHLSAHCLGDPTDHTPRCLAQRADHFDDLRFRAGGRRLGGVARAINDGPGALPYAAAQFASGLGWLLVLSLAALAVAGEWQSGSIASTLTANPSLWRFILAKLTSIWAAAVGAMVGVGGVLALAPRLAASHFPPIRIPTSVDPHKGLSQLPSIPVPVNRHWESASFIASRLALATLVLAAFCVVAVALAAIVRRPLYVLIIGIAGLVLSTAGFAASAYSPISVVSAAMGFNHLPFGIEAPMIWQAPGQPGDIYATPGPTGVNVGVGLAWVAVAAALLPITNLTMSVRDRI